MCFSAYVYLPLVIARVLWNSFDGWLSVTFKLSRSHNTNSSSRNVKVSCWKKWQHMQGSTDRCIGPSFQSEMKGSTDRWIGPNSIKNKKHSILKGSLRPLTSDFLKMKCKIQTELYEFSWAFPFLELATFLGKEFGDRQCGRITRSNSVRYNPIH